MLYAYRGLGQSELLKHRDDQVVEMRMKAIQTAVKTHRHSRPIDSIDENGGCYSKINQQNTAARLIE